MALQQLSEDTASQIRSAAAIPDICELATALLDNSGYNTVVKVRDIFEAYPVRRKVIDGSAKRLLDDIKAQLQIRSLGHPRITLQLVAKPGDTVIFAYASAPSLNQRMLQIFGPAVALSMEALSLDYDGCSLMGSFSKAPMLYRIQHIFIDGHLVDPPELLIVARTAFPIRQSSRQPLSVLRVEHSERDSHYSEDERSICPIPFAGIGPTQLELFQGSSSGNIHEGLDVASLRVVGQADKKFIICQTDGWLVAIDQHAADERIRLEEHYDTVKFGDPLSAAECQSIVARLARCQFPEFCAHGR
ncbi:hypothetical protein GGH94_002825 [Coemansia aciculifera]|uniref:MutL C-terminal dimerisation domain-containing protein n=1 Tax=Coemansia aciculifera TaxID=417176 RepID=A0A9W8IL78_9FUNG|nr:hypothetical protein GGH94_002825 [Coemansia aciculifera]